MQRKQLAALFIINMIPFIIGNGLLPNLPVYMVELGGDEASAGLYLATAFAALFIGTLSGGWITQFIPPIVQIRRTVILVASIVSLPVMVLMGQAQTPLLLTAGMVVVWFSGGVRTATVNTLAGMYADRAQRGKIFGILGMAAGVGGIVGGLLSGFLAENYGFEILFAVIALTELAAITAALFLEDRAVSSTAHSTRESDSSGTVMTATFWLLFLAAWLVSTLHFGAGLGRPLMMHDLSFGAAAIASTATVIGITNLFVPYLVGYLSDRMERRWLLIACYSAYAVGTLVLAYSTALWHFWLSTILFSSGWAALNVGAALITDLAPTHSLDKAMSRYMSAPWVGGVVGFGTAGFIIKALGTNTTFIVGIILPVLSILLIMVIKDQKRTRITVTQPMPAVSGD